jgi:hypothetical protein
MLAFQHPVKARAIARVFGLTNTVYAPIIRRPGKEGRVLNPVQFDQVLSRRHHMVEVTPAAHHQIAEYFKNKEAAPIRIFLNEGG